MSDQIKHKCGIALIRLLKPLDYYKLRYGTWMYGIHKLYLLMEKQRNRGQDGAGVASLKFDVEPGKKYIHCYRSNSSTPIIDVLKKIKSNFKKIEEKYPDLINDTNWSKNNLPFASEILLGHLRYGTFGKNDIENVHPVLRQNNWKSKNLVLAGNFNLTNVDELFNILLELGQHPKDYSDTVTIIEKIGHFLDEENQKLFNDYKKQGINHRDISNLIAKNLDLKKILHESSKRWDGGYVIAGLIGHGDIFILRDPIGIRPAYYYVNDEIAVATSERPAIQTVFNVPFENIHEIKPGNALIIKKSGEIYHEEINKPEVKRACSFERIYFSRGSDKDIYKERKKLGELLVPKILKNINYDIQNTVFSFIPNTAETAFYGMIDGIENYINDIKKKEIIKIKNDFTEEKLDKIISLKARIEKIAIKDVKLRTFISGDEGRNDLVEHVYDITYGTVRKDIDTLVIIDDSIVRGTTLKQSILKILDRLCPKRIIVVSSSPQIRYPDCYGIDMAKLSDFIAFNAAIELLKESGLSNIINDVYNKSKNQQNQPKEEIINYVKEIYKPFSAEQISNKIAESLKNNNIKAEVDIIYQSIEDLHIACPDNTGDWYFTGDYPTSGGNKVVNNSFINYIEGKNVRAY
ncbi:MAG: amidophosphoribosyltransferase [Bacteroidales bacterium]|nr:amidophosphoribosyltransferase [Bacteroidales bacterium]